MFHVELVECHRKQLVAVGSDWANVVGHHDCGNDRTIGPQDTVATAWHESAAAHRDGITARVVLLDPDPSSIVADHASEVRNGAVGSIHGARDFNRRAWLGIVSNLVKGTPGLA